MPPARPWPPAGTPGPAGLPRRRRSDRLGPQMQEQEPQAADVLVSSVYLPNLRGFLPSELASLWRQVGLSNSAAGRLKLWRPFLKAQSGGTSSATAVAGSSQSSTTRSAALPTSRP